MLTVSDIAGYETVAWWIFLQHHLNALQSGKE